MLILLSLSTIIIMIICIMMIMASIITKKHL